MSAGDTEATNLTSPELNVLLWELFVVGRLKVLNRRLVVWELVGRVLAVLGKLERGVLANGTLNRRKGAGDEVKKGRLSGTVITDNGNTRVHVHTEGEVAVEVVLLLARVGESDVAERDNRRGKLANVFEVEAEDLGYVDFLDETGGLHLVDDLLLGLGLTNQVGVGTGTGNEL
jgi:hypothetical protein